MVFFYPVESVADKEVFYFIFAVIKDFCAPVRVLALAGILIFKKRMSVKISQSMGIFREMGRNPVKDNADAIYVNNLQNT